ncbi:MAG: transcription-repair coupling factor, partial [Acidothermus cellulolyticus]|nr:transcription-repair coupling factor [Acidothermus cellulolyticus]
MVPGVCLTGFGMDLRGLITALLGDDGFARARDAASEGIANVEVGVPRPLRAFITALIAADAPYGAGRPVLAVTATEREATELATALEPLLPAGAVAEYPAWETLPHERLSPRADTVGRRVAVRRLLREQGGTLRVITTPVRALLQPQVAGLGDLEPVELRPGDEADLNDVVARLVAIGYHRVDLVERRGEIAVRGGILDIFPPTAEHPLRVEFFGDRIEEIRPFRAGDQRSFGEPADRVWATACRELLLTDRVVTRAAELAQRYPQLADILGKVAHGVVVEGMEALAPLLADEMNLLLDEVPSQTVVVVCDPERVRARAADVVRTGEEFLHAAWAGAAAGGNVPIDLAAAALRPFADVRRHAADLGLAWWSISPLQTTDAAEFRDDAGEVVIVPDAHEAPAYRGDTQALVADVKGWLGEGLRVAVLTAGHGSAQRIVEVLAGEDVAARWTETIPEPPDHDLVSVSCGGLDAGFIARGAGLVVLTETEIFGTRAAARNLGRLPSRRRKSIDPLELRPGDFVVHEQHGVGRFVGMATREIGGATREYLVIEYAPSRRGQPGDRLWVPTDSLDQVTRYVGGEAPTLDRIGGADWARRKGRARKAVREIAAELIQLYSARMASPGHAFGPDTPWQRELEEAFPYVETPDQLRTIEEVKADMERPVPMDRLICGDVGYGKTEIAVRAA